ncbi:hypothetical protein FMEAI12_5150011 [Parafrankia sp. Ea1.12]|nr:hypothetical protein FMEAI12_5150011 [Parafrankia sp. Ea1.12]
MRLGRRPARTGLIATWTARRPRRGVSTGSRLDPPWRRERSEHGVHGVRGEHGERLGARNAPGLGPGFGDRRFTGVSAWYEH